MDSESSHDIRARQRTAARLMKRILMHFRTSMDEQLRPYGITKAQLQLLFAIRNAPNSSGAALSRQCDITPQTGQAFLRRAEKAGWTTRGKDPVNARIVTAALTPAGEALMKTVDNIVTNIEAQLWQNIPQPQIESLIQVLEQCQKNIDTP